MTQAEVDDLMTQSLPGSDSQDSTERPGLFYALTFRNYRLFFVGQLISVAGTWMQDVAQKWTGLGTHAQRDMAGHRVGRKRRSIRGLCRSGAGRLPTAIRAAPSSSGRRPSPCCWRFCWHGSGLALFARAAGGVARRGDLRAVGHRECVQYARAAGVRDRHGGGQKGPVQRHCAQLPALQSGAGAGADAGGDRAGEIRRGAGVSH